ncbi:MAG TPA: hypothetical protein VMN56_19790 [Casimicrobiaceae bacterium]|nr:hypothetical protein [Casimicrobiaceae bacterium]
MHELPARLAAAASVLMLASACANAPARPAPDAADRDRLAGAWRSQVRFTGGALSGMKDLEFMYVFNAGGTMTESSNYDGAPPVPPAYGVWKSTGPRKYEAKYVFYVTKPPASFEDVAKGGGWLPVGHGVLSERITLSADGNSYRSTISYAAFDRNGNPVEGSGEGDGTATRIGL